MDGRIPENLVWSLIDLDRIIEKCYSEPHRFYHTQEHLTNMIKYQTLLIGDSTDVKMELRLATMFHDAVYDPARSDNEEKSAEMAVEWVKNNSSYTFRRMDTSVIHDLIMCTKNHVPIHPSDLTEAIIIDSDLGGIGQSYEVFEFDGNNVRKEYEPIYGTELFIDGRKKWIQSMLAKPQIYWTPYGLSNWEAQARDNLKRSFDELERHNG